MLANDARVMREVQKLTGPSNYFKGTPLKKKEEKKKENTVVVKQMANETEPPR